MNSHASSLGRTLRLGYPADVFHACMKRLIIFLTILPGWAGADITAEQNAFFEANIRPVLASACYECHGAEKQKGDLRLDWRDGLLTGGEHGPAIVPGDPDKSLLMQAIAHTHAELKMPKNADRLSDGTVASFRAWIRNGAPDPRDKPAADSASDWPAAFALRKQWWCWQPLKQVCRQKSFQTGSDPTSNY